MISYNDIPEYIIPCWDNGIWTQKEFLTREDFVEFLLPLFKEPGLYNFDDTAYVFNEQARKFKKNGEVYCLAAYMSKDFIAYWNDQKDKCRKGVIFINGDNTWYLPRDYYMWLNFLPIYDKEKKNFDFASVRDAQYHMALYECLAELNYKHASILKKRQIASSYFHMGKFINQIWFEPGVILKLGASLKDYIGLEGSWKFLDEYRAFLNSKTAWYRPMNPGKVLTWQQKIEVTENGRKQEKGLKGMLQGMSFEQSDTKGVGGPCSYFFYEEAGIAPTMDKTFEYLRPAMQSGEITTGLFICAGSVGDLSQCKPLEGFTRNPDANGMYSVESNLIDETGAVGKTALFIPEQWSMPPYIDKYGNSLVEEAIEAILKIRKEWKDSLSPELYQLRISQHPMNIKEAFAFRDESIFPLLLIGSQKKRIEDKEYPYEFVELERTISGTIESNISRRLPITEFPVDKKREDKRGVIVVYERPIPESKWGTYYASIDPVSEGKAEHIDNMLYTPTGRKRIGDIQIGDQVIGSNGKSTNVIGIYPQGIKKMCNITFSDGHSIKVCEDHLWNVKLNGGTKGYITLSVKNLLDTKKTITYKGTGRNIKKEYTISTYYKDKQNRNRWSIPIVKPIEFNTSKDVPINPYLLGLLLGDGGLSQRSIRFSTVDEELVRAIQHLLPKDLIIKKVKNSHCDYAITTTVGSRNSLSQKLKELGLKGKTSKDKFIPEEYMYSFGFHRLALLQGLMDTDGSCTNHGAEFYSSSKTLAYQVVELVQSLGGIAKIRCKKTTHLDSYIVRVLLPSYLEPFILKRKREIYKPSQVFSRHITDIQYIEDAEAVCISVDAPDNLYVTEHAIVTHNTTTSESLCSIYIYKNPVEVTKLTDRGVENLAEGDKIVASWCGRYDDLSKTHEQLELIIEWYNAWAIVENNVSLFIQYMIEKRKQKYLVPKNQIVFLKDIGYNKTVYADYGWKNTGTIFKSHLLSYLISWLTEEINQEVNDDGDIKSTTYGIERLPDYMALVEMEQYRPGVNVDRLVSLAALIAFAKVQQSNRGYSKRVDDERTKKLQNSENLYKLNNSPFRHMGRGSSAPGKRTPRMPYRRFK